ncbi:hypothetical protein E2C01_012874 [Portunus trituberculatus]|uniref:Uncharacterized protein n=1 Tax=Portunus trituberculatus TaxID=210409 RepID=A0A5B7DFV3_PORTR|nr:hypothetical protein [Portunus trituberculatus]
MQSCLSESATFCGMKNNSYSIFEAVFFLNVLRQVGEHNSVRRCMRSLAVRGGGSETWNGAQEEELRVISHLMLK